MATARTPRQGTGWSPFARPAERHCEAVADALLRVVKATDSALDELDTAAYTDFRRRNPQLGLPRASTVSGACGSWEAAIEHAAVKAEARHRESVAGGAGG
jgi:hypothetical protein